MNILRKIWYNLARLWDRLLEDPEQRAPEVDLASIVLQQHDTILKLGAQIVEMSAAALHLAGEQVQIIARINAERAVARGDVQPASETLDQVLSNGQQPVAKAFEQAFAQPGMAGKPLEVRVAYRLAGEAWQKLWEATLPPEQSRPESVPHIIEAIRNVTLQILGSEPSADLRFRVYVRGKSAEAQVNITREVRPDFYANHPHIES